MNRRSAFCLLFLATILITASGCVSESESGGTRTFAYQLWAPLSVFLVGLLMAPVGWLLRQQRYSWVFLVGGPLLAFLLAPTLFYERATLDDKQYSTQGGLW